MRGKRVKALRKIVRKKLKGFGPPRLMRAVKRHWSRHKGRKPFFVEIEEGKHVRII